MAAGQGTRLGAGRPKGLVPLGRAPHREPVVVHALRGALRCPALTHVVVVAPADPEPFAEVRDALVGVVDPAGAVEVQVVPGGAERSDSVALGLRALPVEVGTVLVHDAARALAPVEVFDRVVAALRAGHPAVTPAVPVTDTVKEVSPRADAEGMERVVATLDRSVLRAVQTPQGFERATLERAHAGAGTRTATDDCGLVEALGVPVTVVPGSPRSMKITTPSDLAIAAAWVEQARAEGAPSAARGAVRTAEPAGLAIPVLVVLSGLPGVGKTSLARAVCRRLGAAHLRVDTVEQGLLRGGLPETDLGAQGYGAAYAVAADQLGVGLSVVADMVNGVDEARSGWEKVATEGGAAVVRVLVACSDPQEHRRRVEGRPADIPGHRLPDWQQTSTRGLAPWPEAHLRLDTADLDVEDAADRVLAAVTRLRQEATTTEEDRP